MKVEVCEEQSFTPRPAVGEMFTERDNVECVNNV